MKMGDLEGCSKDDLISFIKHRVNTKLGDLGYPPVVNGIDPNALKRMKWFDSLSAGKQHTDFFANRVTNYSKGHMEWDAEAQYFKLWMVILVADTTNWAKGKDYPEWMDEVGVATISKGYLLPDETPKKSIQTSRKSSLRQGLTDQIWRISSSNTFGMVGLGLASPVLSNTGTDRGLTHQLFWY